jgi:hypothetical protein
MDGGIRYGAGILGAALKVFGQDILNIRKKFKETNS